MKTILLKTWYKVTTQGRIHPTVAGWVCLIAWTYFVCRLIYTLTHPYESNHNSTGIIFYLSATIGSIILSIGTWLIYTLFSYNYALRKLFRSLATQFWMEQITNKKIPPPPVKKVLYDYFTWTTTVIYPDHCKIKATFHFIFDTDGPHSQQPPEITPL